MKHESRYVYVTDDGQGRASGPLPSVQEVKDLSLATTAKTRQTSGRTLSNDAHTLRETE